MKKIPFSHAEFIRSALFEEQFPTYYTSGRPSPEIAFVGRSNVGKSSLINHLLRKKMARVSSTPGKTQTLNFFRIDQVLTLVDLPGYGYAKVPHALREKWSHSIQNYLAQRPALSLILLLLDIRHPPTEEDLAFVRWAVHEKKEILFVFTKTDKLKAHERERHAKILLDHLNTIDGIGPLSTIFYSIEDLQARSLLIQKINALLEHHGIDQ